ncbi:MAG: YgcG family protein, partial [Rhodocyclaceae bacterium]|nr:YgcG family protein [Rhodocyclaceae bacterium]
LRAVMAVIDGEALPAPAEARGGAAAGDSGTGDPLTWLFGAAVLAPVLHAILGLLGSLAAAAIGAAAGWWMFDSWIAAGAGAAILFALSFLRGGPGFMGGGGRGGGFGGGGGGFGGGGASGRW